MEDITKEHYEDEKLALKIIKYVNRKLKAD